MDVLAHLTYQITREYPKNELFGITAQIRRASLSIVLNYIEGYARQRNKVYKNFLEISYGSLKEVKYLLHFSLIENYINKDEYQKTINLTEEIGAMLWTTLQKIK